MQQKTTQMRETPSASWRSFACSRNHLFPWKNYMRHYHTVRCN